MYNETSVQVMFNEKMQQSLHEMWQSTVNREIFASILFSRFSRNFHECTVKRELKTHENFNSNALTIKFLQQTRNFVYR
jgi:hypothetical protein